MDGLKPIPTIPSLDVQVLAACASFPSYCRSVYKLLWGTKTTSQVFPAEQLTTALRRRCALDCGGNSSGNFMALIASVILASFCSPDICCEAITPVVSI